MALPKSFSEIQVDAQGCEFVIHKPSGVRYYINRKVDPKLNGTAGFRQTPWTEAERAGAAPVRVADVVSAGAPLPARYAGGAPAPAPQPLPAARRVILARFIKGSAPKDNNEYR